MEPYLYTQTVNGVIKRMIIAVTRDFKICENRQMRGENA